MVEGIGASVLREPLATARSGTGTTHSLDRLMVAALFGRKGHAARAIRPTSGLELHGAGTAGDDPSNRATTHWRFDQIARITAGDDAPTGDRERIELRLGISLDGRFANRLTGYALGAIT